MEPSPLNGAPAQAGAPDSLSRATRRVALGVSYRGSGWLGWQSQPNGRTVQDALEKALSRFATQPVSTVCAGRTDTGVHGINQVVHLDTPLQREAFSWVRGTNSFLPPDIAVQWAMEVPEGFHARNSARGRRYAYIVLEAPVRPAIESGQVGWVVRPLDLAAMQEAAAHLLGEHDFSSFRSAQCQSPTPVKTLRDIRIRRGELAHRPVVPGAPDLDQPEVWAGGMSAPHAGLSLQGRYWRFDFEGQAFLHHMIRNIMGCLLAVGSGSQPPSWVRTVLEARRRDIAAPTFSPDGLYFLGPRYDPHWQIPNVVPALAWLPL